VALIFQTVKSGLKLGKRLTEPVFLTGGAQPPGPLTFCKPKAKKAAGRWSVLFSKTSCLIFPRLIKHVIN
jgi:hypothetical protein